MGRVGKKHDRMAASSRLSHHADALDFGRLRRSMRGGSTPECLYAELAPIEHRKFYAQFFTPPRIAQYMAEWAVTTETGLILDPAMGMGALVRAAQARSCGAKVIGFEKDPVILRAFRASGQANERLELVEGDFLTTATACAFDGLLMNPPYLRHHDMDYDFDIFQRFSVRYGVDVSRLSNAYMLFTLKAVAALRPGGRGAILIPTEWMNANFGEAMKVFLLRDDCLKEIIYFSNCTEIFDDALTTACLLLIERGAV